MLRRSDPLQLYAQIGGQKLVDAVKHCDSVTRQYDQRYLPNARARMAAPWRQPGGVLDVRRYERGIRLRCEHAWIELEAALPSCVRVRARPDGDFSQPPTTPPVARRPPIALELTDADDVLELRTGSIACRVSKQSFHLRVELLPDYRLIYTDAGGVQWRDTGGARLSALLTADETCYGLGLRAAGLNLRGRRFKLWNADPGVYGRDTDPLYYSVPFYIGIRDHAACGLFWDNPSRGWADLGATGDDLVFEAETGEACYYIFAGTDAASVLSCYTEITGRVNVPPLWALGYGQAANAASLGEMAGFRERSIPADVCYIDGDAHRLAEVIPALHAEGFRVITTVKPGVPAELMRESERALFLQYPDGIPAVGASWSGVNTFPDFGSSRTRAWWSQRLAPLINAGIDGFALDMAEPTVLTIGGQPGTLPDYVTHGGRDMLDHTSAHNLNAGQMATATEAALTTQPDHASPVVVTRSGYAGLSRSMLTSTGAASATWDHLRLSLSQILNLSLSGVMLAGADVGGFFGEVEPELFTRWLQAMALMPFLRASRSGTTPFPWSFGQPYEVINRLTLQLRYRLLPYLYSMIAVSREYGVPVIRPLFMLEPANALLRSLDDAYLLGDILVAPVLEHDACRRSVYLPVGLWYDFWTYEPVMGGQVIDVSAALDRLPLFIRAGAVLPMWSDVQRADAPPQTPLVLRVFPGHAETVLYEARGEGREVEQGDYRWVYITCAWESDARLIITRRTAGRYQPPYQRIRVEVVGFADEPLEVRLDRHGAPVWFFDNGVLEVTAHDGFQRIEITRQASPTDDTLSRR